MKYGGIEFENKYIVCKFDKNEIIFHNISLISDNYIRISSVKLVEQLNINEVLSVFCLEGLSLRV